MRGRVAVCADAITGSLSAGRVTTATMSPNGVQFGAVGGAEMRALVAANLPPHSHSGTTGVDSPDHTHGLPPVMQGSAGSGPSTGAYLVGGNVSGLFTGGASARHAHPFTTDNGLGSSVPLTVMQPSIITNYILFAGSP